MNLQEMRQRRQQALEKVEQTMAQVARATDPSTFENAMQDLEQIAEEDPGSFEPHYQLACALDALAGPAEAAERFLEAVMRDSRLGGDPVKAWRVYDALATAAEEAGHATQAQVWMQRFLAHHPLAEQAPQAAVRGSRGVRAGHGWLEIYQAACRWQNNMQLQTAVEKLWEVTALQPAFAPAFLRLGMCMRSLGRNEEALRALEQSFRLDENPRTLVEEGLVYSALGNAPMEERCYRRSLELNPRDPYTLFQLGGALFERQDRAQALDLLQEALAMAPFAAWSTKAWEMVEAIVRAGVVELPAVLRPPIQWRRWEDLAEGVSFQIPVGCVDLPADDPAHQAGMLFRVGDTSRHFVFEARLRILSGNAPDDEQWLRGAEAGLSRLTNQLIQRKERVRVSGFPALVVDLRRSQPEEMTFLAYVVRNGQVFEFRGFTPLFVWRFLRPILATMLETSFFATTEQMLVMRLERVVEHIAREPEDVSLVVVQAETLEGLGRLEEARRAYERVVELDPRNFRGLVGLGQCLWQMECVDQALRFLEAAVSIRPDVEVYRTLGLAYSRKRRLDQAARAYMAAYDLAPLDVAIQLLLAGVLEGLRRYAEAEQVLQMGLEQRPDDIETRLLLGALYRTMRRNDESIACLSRAVELDSKSVKARLELGLSLMDKGCYDRAEKILLDAHIMDRGNAVVLDALEEATSLRKGIRRR